jgi:hypothetical protein
MGILAWIAVFLLGAALAVQVAAALFGFIDVSFAGPKQMVRVLWRLLLWGGLCAVIAVLLSPRMQEAFLWGLAVYPFYQGASFLALKLLVARNVKALSREVKSPNTK